MRFGEGDILYRIGVGKLTKIKIVQVEFCLNLGAVNCILSVNIIEEDSQNRSEIRTLLSPEQLYWYLGSGEWQIHPYIKE